MPIKKIFQTILLMIIALETIYFLGLLQKNNSASTPGLAKQAGSQTAASNVQEIAARTNPAPTADNLGWWGQVNAPGVSVRKQSSSQSARLGSFSTVNRVKVLQEVRGETINGNNVWYKIDGGVFPGAYVFSAYVDRIAQPTAEKNPAVPPGVAQGDYWIDVNITKETLTLFRYDTPVFATYVSTGRGRMSTRTGTFHIWSKFLKTRMHGGPPLADHVYDLPNVPYVMYYSGSFAVHGTYWHDKFETPQSAGCTNVTQGDAKFIFDKVSVGTAVHNHY